jgi:cysteinyl-tRNA synthetase
MKDDFNTGGAVGVLFEMVNAVNKMAHEHKLEDPGADPRRKAEFRESAVLLRDLGQLLGLNFSPPEARLGGDDSLVAGLMQLLIDLRNNLRTTAKAIAAKDDPTKKALFDQTDLIRKRLGGLRVTLEDRPDGTTWRVG